MPTTLPADDQDLDPTELADQDDTQDDADDDVAVVAADTEAAPLDPDAEIVAEINKVIVDTDDDEEEEGAGGAPVKKAGMISEELIQKPLSFDDLYDDGYL